MDPTRSQRCMSSLQKTLPTGGNWWRPSHAAWRRLRWVVGIAGAIAIAYAVIVQRSLPDDRQIRALGDTSRVTTLFDAYDRPLFTLFRGERT